MSCGSLALAICLATTSVAAEPGTELRHFVSMDLGISFDYPANWGDPVITALDNSSQRCSPHRYGRPDWVLRFSDRIGMERKAYGVELRVYQDILTQPVRCYGYEGETADIDLRDVIARIEGSRKTSIGGMPGTFEDTYFEPAQTVHRSYLWCSTRRLYDLDFYAFRRSGDSASYEATMESRAAESEAQQVLAGVERLLSSVKSVER